MAFQLISAREAESLMNHWEYVVIDLRNDRDYRKGHMQGALNLPYEFLDQAGDISFIAAMAEPVCSPAGGCQNRGWMF